jgi:hypothetical protein
MAAAAIFLCVHQRRHIMRKTILAGAVALIGMIAADPAFCMQNGAPTTSQTQPDEPMGPDGQPVQPVPPISDPSQPSPPITEPLPPEMPPVAGEARDVPSTPNEAPVMTRSDAPVGPMATPPTSGNMRAESGGTTRAMMTPQPATKTYPLCSKTLQDNCRNPGEGTSSATRPRG